MAKSIRQDPTGEENGIDPVGTTTAITTVAATAATSPSSPLPTNTYYSTSILQPPPAHIPRLSLMERYLHVTSLTPNTFTNTYAFVRVPGARRIFGGEILGQCIVAAAGTVPETFCLHSIHSSFVLMGNPEIPIKYEVADVRTGRSFATREVKATQKGQVIVVLIASFLRQVPAKKPTPGAATEWQVAMPEVLQPWEIPSEQDKVKQAEAILSSLGETIALNKFRNLHDPSIAADEAALSSAFAALHRRKLQLQLDPFDWREIERPFHFVGKTGSEASSYTPTEAFSSRKLRYWVRAREPLLPMSSSGIPHAQLAALVYCTDYWFIGTPLRINPATASGDNYALMISLDHIVYLHLGPETRVDEPGDQGWLLVEMDAPWLANGRTVITQRIWRASDGRLVATCFQQGLIKLKDDSTGETGVGTVSSRSGKL